ncbi:MAG: Glutamate/gamma-aminobutyrate antiporter [Chlamydiia bacterium]|nr:Glutamate/gamma-aminobutyrate antiporter [Chlamydiia bacterium]MCH9615680.1 Glutamate/gamma-aminobutyrate antiporter [Chlamydiia bacterium]MCH9628917.1 Glutamate/gamma-aminobutyrate antiporter [Chlamydiia bacterium]
MLDFIPMRTLSVFILAMINVAAIFSIKNLPFTAEYGFASVFYFLMSAIFFFIPASLVSAELATGWPERGGVYAWVKEAMGHRLGFLAVWLQWIENVVYYPSVLTFIAGTIAYLISPILATNPIYTFVMVLVIFWFITWLNLRGMRTSGFFSALTVITGSFIPAALIIGLGCYWFFTDEPTTLKFTFDNFIPDLSSPGKMSLLTGVLLGLMGMEMSAAHAKEVKNPQKDFPRAILLSAIIIIALSVLGSLAIAVVLPAGKIALHAGAIESISMFLKAYHVAWLIPVFTILIAFGALGTLSTWAAGPAKGLLAAAQDGDFPPALHSVNKHGMPLGMMIFQGIIVTILATLFLVTPDVKVVFWKFIDLSAQLYLLMYILMFISAIILRYKRPNVERAYRVPGGNFGMWLICSLGIIGSVFAVVIGCFPPDQIENGNALEFTLFQIIGIIVLSCIPFVILLFKRPSWNENNPK